jgi:tellurite resistance protein TerC
MLTAKERNVPMALETLLWTFFGILIPIVLILDLGVFHRKAHVVKIREALIWWAVWVGLALLFNAAVYYFRGREAALNFLTGYLLEESLSVDNLFVFLLIFSFFRVPAQYQHKVLFWGILGAILTRAVFIVCGIALIQKFQWLIYLFGIFLIYTAVKLALEKDKEVHPESNPLLKLFRRLMPVTKDYVEGKFFVKQGAQVWATPLFVVLLAVETTDVIFAVDSIPAIFGITTDPFIVYTSNIFAILGLRSIYFALAGMMEVFHLLHYGLAAILAFIGVKMLLSGFIHVPIGVALGVVVGVLAVSIIASIVWPKKGAVVSDNFNKPNH